MIQEPAKARLQLKSHPENVALVRATLTGFAEAAELSDELTADLKSAVSEACNNVALHAYDGSSGPMTVEIEGRHDGVGVVVSDRGRGITKISVRDDRMGLGLALIGALADRAEFLTPQGGGTEVHMWFARETAEVQAPADASSLAPLGSLEQTSTELTGEIVAWFAPADLLQFILGRIVRSVAASSHFSVSRVSDLRAVNDAIARYAELAADGDVGVAISSSSRRLNMTGGPFTVLGAQDPDRAPPDRTQELEQRKETLAGVVDALRTERVNGHELLHIEVVDTSRDVA
jgi:serine/threonine-protein kinase RsbW